MPAFGLRTGLNASSWFIAEMPAQLLWEDAWWLSRCLKKAQLPGHRVTLPMPGQCAVCRLFIAEHHRRAAQSSSSRQAMVTGLRAAVRDACRLPGPAACLLLSQPCLQQDTFHWLHCLISFLVRRMCTCSRPMEKNAQSSPVLYGDTS